MRKNFLRAAFALLVSVPFLTSCFDNDVDPTGYGDAYLMVKIVGQDTLYGLGLHAFSYSDFSAVTAAASSAPTNTYTLQAYMGYKQDFIWLTPENQYSEELPVTGDYTFNATFATGESLVLADKLYTDRVYPPALTTCQYSNTSHKVEVKWTKPANAAVYTIRMFDSDGDLLFVSPSYNSSTDNYSFGKESQGWQTTTFPSEGTTCTVEVTAYRMKTPSAYSNVQCAAKSRQDITWGN